MEAPILRDPIEEGLAAEEPILEELILPNPVEEMAQKHSIALDRWFPTA